MPNGEVDPIWGKDTKRAWRHPAADIVSCRITAGILEREERISCIEHHVFFGVVATVACLSSAASPAFASVNEINLVGQRSSGHYFAGGDVIRTFAGTFGGNFTSEDCASAAGQISEKFRTSDQTVNLGDAAGVIVPLERDRRMLVLGVIDESAGRWFHICINLAATLTDSYRYENGNGPYASSGFVLRSVTFNGERFTIKFANSDQPVVGLAFLRG